jgi:hypothetical protein
LSNIDQEKKRETNGGIIINKKQVMKMERTTVLYNNMDESHKCYVEGWLS